MNIHCIGQSKTWTGQRPHRPHHRLHRHSGRTTPTPHRPHRPHRPHLPHRPQPATPIALPHRTTNHTDPTGHTGRTTPATPTPLRKCIARNTLSLAKKAAWGISNLVATTVGLDFSKQNLQHLKHSTDTSTKSQSDCKVEQVEG